MKLKICSFILIQVFIQPLIFGQSFNEKIHQVENTLMPYAQVVGKEVQKFNIEDRMRFYHVPAISIAIINNGEIEWAKAYGLADSSTNEKATTKTLFQAGSISKSLNAACIQLLVRENKLNLSNDFRTYLKTWKFPENEFSKDSKITIQNLLNHTAGFTVHGFNGYAKGDSIPSINQTLDGKRPANNSKIESFINPNERYEYSGGGITVLQKILQDNFDKNYARLLKVKILNPLKMGNSTFSRPLPISFQRFAATGYMNRKDIGLNHAEVPGKFHTYPELAAAGLWTTSLDLAKFVIAIQESLKGRKNSLFDSTLMRSFLIPIQPNTDAAMGFFYEKLGGQEYFYHGGGTWGFTSTFYGTFNSGQGLVIMTNSDNGMIVSEIYRSIAKVYNWKDAGIPQKKDVVNLDDLQMYKYTGEYYCNDKKVTFSIRKVKNQLEIKRDDNYFEEMFFTNDKQFFVYSTFTGWEFSLSDKREYQLLFNDGQGTQTAIKIK